MESSPEAPEQARKATILRAAVDIFASKGYHGCRIADVAKAAGVAYGLVYHYFDSKDEVLDTLFLERWDVMLAAIVLVVFALQWPESRAALSADLVPTLFILAVLANVAYCAAYPVDVVAQYSGFQAAWKRYRWLLFVVGVVFAGIITRFFAVAMFSRAA